MVVGESLLVVLSICPCVLAWLSRFDEALVLPQWFSAMFFHLSVINVQVLFCCRNGLLLGVCFT